MTWLVLLSFGCTFWKLVMWLATWSKIMDLRLSFRVMKPPEPVVATQWNGPLSVPMPDPLDPILRDVWFKSLPRCWRLYTESAYVSEMLTMTIPEIQRWGPVTIREVWHAFGISNHVGTCFWLFALFLRVMELTCSWSDVYKAVFTVIDVVIRVVERTSQGMNLQSSLDISRTLADKSPTGVPLVLWVSRLRLCLQLRSKIISRSCRWLRDKPGKCGTAFEVHGCYLAE